MKNVSWQLTRLVVVLAILASVILLQAEFSELYAQRVSFNTTDTGFFWPIGTGSFRCTGGIWLGSDGSIPDAPPYDPECGDIHYVDGQYHLGFDMMIAQGNPVFAIAPGIVMQWDDHPSWGSGNAALLIKHILDDGSEFVAVYGHIRTSLRDGAHVSGGVEIATVGPFFCPGVCDHLHFGIHPGSARPDRPYGSRANAYWPDQNGFVDPLDWITTRTPQCSNGSSESYTMYGTPRHPNGALIWISGNPGVYVLQNGQKREICCAQRLYELYGPGRGFDFRDVVFVSQAEFSDQIYPRGSPVFDAIPYSGRCEPPGRLIQQRGQSEISMVTGDCRRRAFSGEAFLRLGYSWCNAAIVDNLSDYQRDSDITQ